MAGKNMHYADTTNPPPYAPVYPTQVAMDPPQKSGLPIVPSAPAHTVYMAQPPVQVGPTPQRICCPTCRADILTRTDTAASTKTHLIALLLCLLGCICCVCVPYCMDSCMKIEHYCPNCNNFIGTYTN